VKPAIELPLLLIILIIAFLPIAQAQQINPPTVRANSVNPVKQLRRMEARDHQEVQGQSTEANLVGLAAGLDVVTILNWYGKSANSNRSRLSMPSYGANDYFGNSRSGDGNQNSSKRETGDGNTNERYNGGETTIDRRNRDKDSGDRNAGDKDNSERDGGNSRTSDRNNRERDGGSGNTSDRNNRERDGGSRNTSDRNKNGRRN
jgi:hypothetical protein